GVTRQRIATSRVTHQHVVDTVDGNATMIAAPDLADYPLDRARAELGPGLLALVASPGRSANDLNHIFSLHLAVADRQEKLFERPHAVRFEHPLQLVAIFRQLGKAHPGAMHLRLEELAAEVDALLALLGPQIAADPVARLGGDR